MHSPNQLSNHGGSPNVSWPYSDVAQMIWTKHSQGEDAFHEHLYFLLKRPPREHQVLINDVLFLRCFELNGCEGIHFEKNLCLHYNNLTQGLKQ